MTQKLFQMDSFFILIDRNLRQALSIVYINVDKQEIS